MVGIKDFTGRYDSGLFGATAAPNCREFTPDEFQMIDFAQVDLSEYIADAEKQANALAQPMKDYMQNINAAGAAKTSTLTTVGD